MHLDDINNLQINRDHCKILVFKQFEKRELSSLGYNVSTVHEFQGKQADHVAVIHRLSNKLERLNHYLELAKPDIVVISELVCSKDFLPQAILNNYILVKETGFFRTFAIVQREASEAFISESTNRSKAIWQIINRERAVRKKSKELSWKLDISAGIDDISARLLKQFQDELCHPLVDIIDKSLLQGVFP
ncbi:hypothetical protein J6590_025102 [Homalodisca vitripennis]|nr:hypothetical protein J6590_025102 [Homalodisca vitripennis]